MKIYFKDTKGAIIITECKNEKHRDKLIVRYKNRGWKQITEPIQTDNTTKYPF